MTPGEFGRRARSGLQPCIDRDSLPDTRPASLPPRRPDPARIEATVRDFIRILGLLPLAIGRGDLVTAVRRALLQRDLLIDLMLEEVSAPGRGRALAIARLLPAEDMAMRAALPAPRAERGEVIAAHMAIARAFLPRAGALTERTGGT